MRRWEDFWINAGFATFLERKVTSRLFGGDFANVEALSGSLSLLVESSRISLLTKNPTYGTLHPVYHGANPDTSISNVPYEQGFELLTFIEGVIGKRAMQSFVQTYVNKNSLTSIT